MDPIIIVCFITLGLCILRFFQKGFSVKGRPIVEGKVSTITKGSATDVTDFTIWCKVEYKGKTYETSIKNILGPFKKYYTGAPVRFYVIDKKKRRVRLIATDGLMNGPLVLGLTSIVVALIFLLS